MTDRASSTSGRRSLQENAGERGEAARIADGTCTPSGISGDVMLPRMRNGAGLAVLNCGAYTSHAWGSRPPTVVLMDRDGTAELVTGPADFAAATRTMYGLRTGSLMSLAVEAFVRAQLPRLDIRWPGGRPLDEVLATASPAAAGGWATQLSDLIQAVGQIKVAGYGNVKLEPDERGLYGDHQSWPGFLDRYLNRAPRLDGHYDRVRDALVAMHADLTAIRPRLMLADLSLRNFVVGTSGLVCGTVPAMCAGDPAASYGEALLHWSGTAGEAVLALAAGVDPRLLSFYAAFHAYVLLAEADRPDTSLFQLMDSYLRIVEKDA